jgi:acyl-CoA thioesterase-1
MQSRSLKSFLVTLSVLAAFTGCGSKEEDASTRAAPPRVESPALKAPEPADVKADTRPAIVALGDSLTAGLGVDPAESYPSRLQRKLSAEGFEYRVVNAGVSGDTSAQGLNRLDAVLDLHPEIVIVALGANDGLRGTPVEETKRNLDTIIRRLKENDVKVLLAGMEIPPNYGQQYTSSFRRIFADLSREHGIPLVKFLLDGVAGHDSLNQQDGVHPTSEGYAIVTENVWSELRPILERPS